MPAAAAGAVAARSQVGVALGEFGKSTMQSVVGRCRHDVALLAPPTSLCSLWRSGKPASQFEERDGSSASRQRPNTTNPSVVDIPRPLYQRINRHAIDVLRMDTPHSPPAITHIAPRLYLFSSFHGTDGALAGPKTWGQRRGLSPLVSSAHDLPCLSTSPALRRLFSPQDPCLCCQHVSRNSRKQDCSSAVVHQPPGVLYVDGRDPTHGNGPRLHQ